LSCGAQAHQVSVVGVCSAAAPLLAGADEPLAALAPDAGAELEVELEHAASAPATARPTAAPATVLAIRERGVVGIIAPLYFSLLLSGEDQSQNRNPPAERSLVALGPSPLTLNLFLLCDGPPDSLG
jgi:hypothetical protein